MVSADTSFHLVFAVDPQDTLKPSVFRSAPSRPPSRVSTRTEHLMGQTGGRTSSLTTKASD